MPGAKRPYRVAPASERPSGSASVTLEMYAHPRRFEGVCAIVRLCAGLSAYPT